MKKIMKKSDQITVKELISVLKKMPLDNLVYARPKYTGTAEWTEDYPINKWSVWEMESNDLGHHTTILF